MESEFVGDGDGEGVTLDENEGESSLVIVADAVLDGDGERVGNEGVPLLFDVDTSRLKDGEVELGLGVFERDCESVRDAPCVNEPLGDAVTCMLMDPCVIDQEIVLERLPPSLDTDLEGVGLAPDFDIVHVFEGFLESEMV